MRPNDVAGIVAAASPRVSPDGTTVAFVVSRVDLDANTDRSQIWLVPADGRRPAEPFSAGEHRDAAPAWSPDGRRLAFTSQRGEEPKKVTLHIAPVGGGGEVVTLATFAESVEDLTWSPDGRHLSFTTRTRDPRYEITDPKRQPPRRITRFFSRLDNTGWTVDRPRHVYVIAADGSSGPINLTPGEFAHNTPDWAPDGVTLACSGARHDTWDLDLAVDLFTVRVGDEEPMPLTKQTGVYGHPSWSPDGSHLAFLGVDNPQKAPQNGRLGVLNLATGERRWLNAGIDRNLKPYPDTRPPVWDGDGVLCTMDDRGNVHLVRLPLHGDGAEIVVGGERCVTSYDAAGGTIAFTATETDRPAELFALCGDEERRLSFVTDGFAGRARLLQAERFTTTAPDGAEIDGWLYLPPDHEPSQRYPALLNVHGGPFTQYGNRFFDEAQVQAAAGYVVIMSNPRGSSGRDEAWGRAINGPKDPNGPGTGWGGVDYDDLMAVTDEALRRVPSIDPARIGVLGGSYGGYMTSWIVGHTNRFAAACSERAVNNMVSEDYASDLASVWHTEFGVTWVEDPETYRQMSPITYVQNIETPMLLLHSEEDLRCPIEQAEQLFVALRLLGKDVELCRFPGEGHEMSRSGSPVHRVQRFELILDFFGKWLGVPAFIEPS